MSIRWALSLGIITLLLATASSQIWLVNLLQGKIEQQINQRSTEISRIVLTQTASQLEQMAMSPPVISIPSGHQKQIQIIEIEQNGEKLDLKELEQVYQNTRQAQREAQWIRTQIQPEQLQQRLAQVQQRLQPDNTSPLIAEFTRYTMLLIIISTLVAMLAALGLGQRLIKPLQQLVQGFQALQQGKLGTQISTGGLREYRYVSEQFNQTSKQLAELAEQATQMQQQQHLAELGEISRGMVHALRNPLHTLNLLLEQVAGSEDHTLRQRLTEQAERKMQHINRSLTAMLTLSCADIDRSKAVAIKPVLQDLLLEFSNGQRQFRLSGDLSAQLNGAETEIRTILHTVLANATEASAANGTIEIHVDQQPAQLCIQIRDQGSGLDQAIVPQLFSPHCSTKSEGAGMGLYLTSRLLKLYYHGDISLRNNPEGGCCATLHFKQEDKHG